jgi:peptidyl-dipeptidase Dcp
MNNPLLQEWDTPFSTPPFNKIAIANFKPAIEKAIKGALSEIEKITCNTDTPGFENTIASLERAGRPLAGIAAILFNLNSAETNSELQSVTRDISPLLARFSNDVTLNEKLFGRVSHVYSRKESENLDREQVMLLEKTYRDFILGGAGLDYEKKQRFREISEELARLSVCFEENVLEDTNAFELHLTESGDLEGLPDGVIEMASLEAKKREKNGWIFTLHSPSYIPFMKYSTSRELREKMFRAFSSRSFHDDNRDNRSLASSIANLRLEIARLLGFNNYAEVALIDRMAETPSRVFQFLGELHSFSGPAAARDFKNISLFALGDGHEGIIEKWDWPYYSERLQKAKFNIDEETLRPYFVLENTERAVFDLASKLYGIKFTLNNEIQLYHPEVKTWEVSDEDGTFLAILYIDYFPRPGKSGGAWMTSYREQSRDSGKDTRPLVSIVANFTRPTGNRPSLLSFTEVTTLLHEFGHSLHAMLTRCTYQSLSGTSVARDFVELPSQFMENYAFEKEWLSTFARHYITGEVIPDEMIEKIKASSAFNEGYACNRQVGFAFLDMAWHSISSPLSGNIEDFETAAISKTELFPPVKGTNMSVSFTHIFGGGYAAGYYGYKWAEVLDADAFSFFRERGIFDKEAARAFRTNILEKGGTDKPANLYMHFRGREPSVDAFLERSGLR